jgi:hypothetical protein
MIQVNWLAILVSVILMFFFGGLWYGPLFGRAWGTAMGIDMSKKPCAKDMIRPMALQIIGCVLVAYVITFGLNVWRPSSWNIDQVEAPAYVYGLSTAFWTWLGFYVPLQLSKVGWEMRPWKVFFINAGHDFGNLLIVSMIIAYWR